jgi:hypothetical protein
VKLTDITYNLPRNYGPHLYVCGHINEKVLTFGFEISSLEMRLNVKYNFKVLRKEGLYRENYMLL